jgi:biotin carboxyl carrier protein
MKREFENADGTTLALSAQKKGSQVLVVTGDRNAVVQLRQAPNGDWLVEQDGITRTVQLSRTGDVAWLSAPGADFPSLTTRWTRVEARRGSQHAAGAEVRSPMTGRVVVVHVREGDVVEKGQALVVVEAMKMEHGLKAPRAGVVAKVTCKPGDLVEGGVELVVLAEQEAS